MNHMVIRHHGADVATSITRSLNIEHTNDRKSQLFRSFLLISDLEYKFQIKFYENH